MNPLQQLPKLTNPGCNPGLRRNAERAPYIAGEVVEFEVELRDTRVDRDDLRSEGHLTPSNEINQVSHDLTDSAGQLGDLVANATKRVPDRAEPSDR